jgi:hypothetical protein
VERASPGLAALFAALSQDGRHSVLDLGSATGRSLRLLGRFARQIRFMGLIPESSGGDSLVSALRALPPNPDRPYDVVLAWDVLDRIDPEDRSPVVARLVELTAPGARLYVVVHSDEALARRPVRLRLVDLDRVSQEPAGPPELAHPQLLPAQLERLLAPFEVVNAFMLRVGVREYVALKP